MPMLNAQSRARLKRRLLSIPDHVKEAAAQSLAESAADLVGQIRAGVPVDQGDLRDSVREYDAEDEAGVGRRIVAGSRKAFHAGFIEHGTRRSPAQPFFFPTYRRNKRKIRSRLSKAIKAAVQKPGA